MTTSLLQVVPPTPALHPLHVFSLEHMKLALNAVTARDVIVAGASEPTTVAGCALVGGGLMVLVAMAADTVVLHEKRHLGDISVTDVNAVVVLEGGGVMSTSAGEMAFRAGDVYFIKAQSPSMVRIDENCRLLVLRIPFSRFSLGLGSSFDDFTPSLGRHDSPLRLATWNYVHQVLPALGDSTLDAVAHAEQAFVALLAAVYAESRQQRGELDKPSTRWDAVVTMVDAMLDDPDLSVAKLAVALGISTRRVHMLFSSNGHRYSGYLLDRRLLRVGEVLCNPLYADFSVTDLGYRCGFRNASQFNRHFKERYGMSPSAYRSAAMG